MIWVEVLYDHGWGRHTRSWSLPWAMGMAEWLALYYPETRVCDRSGVIIMEVKRESSVVEP